MIQKLTQQMNDEPYSSTLYLQMSAWCRDKAYDGGAKFFREHAHEEMQRMMRLFDYHGWDWKHADYRTNRGTTGRFQLTKRCLRAGICT